MRNNVLAVALAAAFSLTASAEYIVDGMLHNDTRSELQGVVDSINYLIPLAPYALDNIGFLPDIRQDTDKLVTTNELMKIIEAESYIIFVGNGDGQTGYFYICGFGTDDDIDIHCNYRDQYEVVSAPKMFNVWSWNDSPFPWFPVYPFSRPQTLEPISGILQNYNPDNYSFVKNGTPRKTLADLILERETFWSPTLKKYNLGSWYEAGCLPLYDPKDIIAFKSLNEDAEALWFSAGMTCPFTCTRRNYERLSKCNILVGRKAGSNDIYAYIESIENTNSEEVVELYHDGFSAFNAEAKSEINASSAIGFYYATATKPDELGSVHKEQDQDQSIVIDWSYSTERGIRYAEADWRFQDTVETACGIQYTATCFDTPTHENDEELEELLQFAGMSRVYKFTPLTSTTYYDKSGDQYPFGVVDYYGSDTFANLSIYEKLNPTWLPTWETSGNREVYLATPPQVMCGIPFATMYDTVGQTNWELTVSPPIFFTNSLHEATYGENVSSSFDYQLEYILAPDLTTDGAEDKFNGSLNIPAGGATFIRVLPRSQTP